VYGSEVPAPCSSEVLALYSSEVLALYSPGGSMRCSQMPEEGLVIVWQLGASSVFATLLTKDPPVLWPH
jgi:hypothetical protein